MPLRSAETRGVSRTNYLIALGVIIVAFAVQVVGGVNPDMSWLLTAGERMLSGQQLYVDIYELNPPMSALMYLPTTILAHWLGVPPEWTVVAAILGLVWLSVIASGYTLRRFGLLQDSDAFWLTSIVALVILPGNNFGEREHIAVILILPLVAVSAARAMGKVPSILELVTAGLSAGLVMTIKPHFALAILLVAVASAFKARSWRPVFNLEHVLGGLVLVAYALIAWVYFPAFFSRMLPLASASYLSHRLSLWELLSAPAMWLTWPILGGLLLTQRRTILMPPYVQYLAAAVGFACVYVIQGRAFIYHALPGLTLVSMVFAQCFCRAYASEKIPPVIFALALAAAPGMHAFKGDSLRAEAKLALAPLGRGLTIASITPHLDFSSPLHRDVGGTLISSSPNLWISLGSLRQQRLTDDPQKLLEWKALEDFERGVLREDLLRERPDIVLSGGDAFDWLGWAKQDRTIANVLQEYDLLATLGPDAAPFQIWHRREP